MPKKLSTLQEIRDLIGHDLEPSPWLTVEQDRIDSFADATDDRQWIHVDPEKARNGPYSGTVAHGFLTLSLIPGLAAQIYQVATGSARINYGADGVRFPSPVPAGSRVRLRAHFLELEEKQLSSRLRVRFTIEVDGQDKPACVAEMITVLLP